MIDDKDSDERYHIDKNYEERVTYDIEVLKLGNWVCRKIQTILRKNLIEEIGFI